MTAAQTNLDNANAAIPGLDAAVTSAASELDAANADLPVKQAAYDEAKAAYDAAYAEADDPSTVDRSALDAAETALSAAKVRVSSAEGALSTAEANLSAGQQAVNDAQSALDAAQATYDQKLETAGAEAEGEAQAAIDAAQGAYNAAKDDLDACQAVIDANPGEIEALESQIETEQAKVTEAQQAVIDAAGAVTDAEGALAEAQSALDDLAEEQAAWDAQAKPLQEAVEAAQGAVDSAKEELDTANGAVTTLNGQISALQEEIAKLESDTGDVQMRAVDDLVDFLAWLHKETYDPLTGTSDCVTALGFLAFACGDNAGWGIDPSGDIESFTHPGEATDATYLDNVLAALDMIDQLNEIRKAEGQKELQVSLAAMIEAAYHANWSAATNTIGHASQNGYPSQWGGGVRGENAAWGYTTTDGNRDFFTGWFYQEKANYTNQAQTDPKTGMVYQPEEGGQTIHYQNIIGRDYGYTGMAVATDMPRYSNSVVNVFSSANTIDGANAGKTFTTDALRQLIERAREEGIASYRFENDGIIYDEGTEDSMLEELRQELETLQSQLEAAQQIAGEKQTAYDNAVNAKTQADENLAAIGARPTNASLQQAVTDAQNALEAAKQAKSDADAEFTRIQGEVDETVKGLNAQKSALETELETAKSQLSGLQQATETALQNLNTTKSQYGDVIETGEAHRTAKANAEGVEADLAGAQGAVDELNAAIEALNSQIETQQRMVGSAKAALDAAGPTQGQIDALNNAGQALEAAKAEVQRLTGARDDAKKAVDEATEAKGAADGLVTELEGDIEAQQDLVDEADAKLPGASAKVAAWEAVFGAIDPSGATDAQKALAKDIVENGCTGAATGEVALVLAGAHEAYAARLDDVALAEQRLVDAAVAYDSALADKAVTEQELAERLADLAMAQDAYNRLAKQMGWGVEEVSARRVVAEDATLTQTGDPTEIVAAGVALVGAAAVAGGAHFRRRRSE